jgi:hypothetical protein
VQVPQFDFPATKKKRERERERERKEIGLTCSLLKLTVNYY